VEQNTEERAEKPGVASQPASTGGSAEQSRPTGGYRIHIPLYEGPLDLLLDLIKQQKMSIHDIRISEITAQYLDYLHKLEELDVDVSAEFIYMAATLIYIKSKMLLPPDPLGGPEEQAADPRA
jgi:segregation and condensation protein A